MDRSGRLKRFLLEFNLFRTYTSKDDDAHKKKIQLLSTRLVVLLFILSLIILIIYICQWRVTKIHAVDYPSLSTYQSLEKIYGDQLICPCSNIAIERGDFLSITPAFHQVCSSDFVADSWLDYLRSTAGVYVSSDFRFTGSVLFSILASFCRLANRTINDSLPSFYSTRFISSKVINRKQFDEEVQSILGLYISTTSNAFAQSFELIRDVTYSNSLLAGLATNFQYQLSDYIPHLSAYYAYPSYRSYGQCSCEFTPSCIAPVKISDLFVVPGLYIGCYLIEAMRQSSLLCLYNQTCLDQLVFHLNSSVNISVRAMLAFNTSRFSPSSNLSEMLGVMMVDAWRKNISYVSYFDRCQPIRCKYSIIERNELIYIVTLIIGIFGGLYKGLLISIPILIKVFLQREEVPTVSLTLRERCSQLIGKSWNSVRTLNLFPSYLPTIDSYDLITEQITTIVYLVLLFLSTLILLGYNANRTVTETIVISTPSLEQYRNLYEKYSLNSLSCPCSTMKSTYGQVIRITPVYHQFCTSRFIEEIWLNPRFNSSMIFFILDLRRSASLIFHSLASYCSLSERTFSDQLRRFRSTSLITPTLLSEILFHNQTNASVRHFTKTFAEDFLQQCEFLRTNIYGNQIINGLLTNFVILFQPSVSTGELKPVSVPSTLYKNCLCDLSPKCTAKASIYQFNGSEYVKQFSFPGLQIGCYTDEALRKSTFECFFNQTCVHTMKNYLNIDPSIDIPPLNASRSIRFNQTTTIDEIRRNLMVERWISNASYRHYFNNCQPSSCSYRIVRKMPFVAVITTLLGLLGGLMDILSIVVPIVIASLRRRRKRAIQTDDQPSINVSFKEKLFNSIRHLNFFRSKTPLDDQIDQSKIQIISTRLFIVLFFLSMIILLTYTSQIEVDRMLTISSPSLSMYLSFYNQHREKIVCPCANTVHHHRQFLSIFAHFHQICSSDFIDPRWSEALRKSHATGSSPVYNRDFRFRSPYYFQTLASFCQLANRTFSAALNTFYSDSLITPQLLSQSIFSSQINATIDLFRTSMINTFVRSFRVLRDTNFGNNLVSTTLSSFTYSLLNKTFEGVNGTSPWQIELRYKSYNSSQCSCRETPTCVEQSFIYTFRPYTPMFPVPGFLVGCYTFESLLLSNLHYFYNQTTLDWFSQALNLTRDIPFRALNVSQLDAFPPDETIERILERMMINRWTQIVSFENYFNHCQPNECRYSYRQKFDLLYIITSVAALIGGLTSVLQLILPCFVRLVRLVRLHHCFSH